MLATAVIVFILTVSEVDTLKLEPAGQVIKEGTKFSLTCCLEKKTDQKDYRFQMNLNNKLMTSWENAEIANQTHVCVVVPVISASSQNNTGTYQCVHLKTSSNDSTEVFVLKAMSGIDLAMENTEHKLHCFDGSVNSSEFEIRWFGQQLDKVLGQEQQLTLPNIGMDAAATDFKCTVVSHIAVSYYGSLENAIQAGTSLSFIKNINVIKCTEADTGNNRVELTFTVATKYHIDIRFYLNGTQFNCTKPTVHNVTKNHDSGVMNVQSKCDVSKDEMLGGIIEVAYGGHSQNHTFRCLTNPNKDNNSNSYTIVTIGATVGIFAAVFLGVVIWRKRNCNRKGSYAGVKNSNCQKNEEEEKDL